MKLHYVLLLLMLASCIPVDDFGAMWDKAKPDPALVGTWQMVGGGKPGNERWTVSAGEKDQRVVMTEANGQPSPEASLARSLTHKGKSFLLLKHENRAEGTLIRYDIANGVPRQWGINNDAAVGRWLAEHPEYSGKLSASRPEMLSSPLKAMGRLDEASLDALAALPEDMWQVVAEYRKRP